MSSTSSGDISLRENRHDTVAWSLTVLQLNVSTLEVHLVEGSAKNYASRITAQVGALQAKSRRLGIWTRVSLVAGIVSCIAAGATVLAGLGYGAPIPSPWNSLTLTIPLGIAGLALLALAAWLGTASDTAKDGAHWATRNVQEGGVARASFRLKRTPAHESAARAFTDAITPKMRDRLMVIARHDGEQAVTLALQGMLHTVIVSEEQQADREKQSRIRSLRREVKP